MKELTVIIPVYNEEEIISFVIEDWISCLRNLNTHFIIRAYDDGSKDTSLALLKELATKYAELEVIGKKNSGHGPTILQGYRETQTDWIFQIDSDNEMASSNFCKLWKHRDDYDYLLGFREKRNQPIARKIVSMISRLTVRIFFGPGVNDVNTPYRLMRRSAFIDAFDVLPATSFAPNVILSGFAVKKNLRIFEHPVPVLFRTTGEVSIKKWKLLKAAALSWYQTIIFALNYKHL